MSKLWTILMLMSAFTCAVVKGHAGGGLQLIATGDNSLTVYLDGKEVGSTNHWTHAVQLTIPANTEVLAMKSVDWGVACGIAASLSTGEVTDTSWKCNTKYQHNWASPYFDDSSWHPAISFGQYGVQPWLHLVTPDPFGSNWIWAAGGCHHKTVYCRKRRGARELIATGDNTLTVYVDGDQVASAKDWTKAVHVNIPKHARLLAMESTDWGVACGIAATVSTGEKTDTSWKCSPHHQAGWTTEKFIDYSWNYATTFGKYGVQPWAHLVSPQPLGADWIWASGGCKHKTVYCRKWLE